MNIPKYAVLLYMARERTGKTELSVRYDSRKIHIRYVSGNAKYHEKIKFSDLERVVGKITPVEIFDDTIRTYRYSKICDMVLDGETFVFENEYGHLYFVHDGIVYGEEEFMKEFVPIEKFEKLRSESECRDILMKDLRKICGRLYELSEIYGEDTLPVYIYTCFTYVVLDKYKGTPLVFDETTLSSLLRGSETKLTICRNRDKKTDSDIYMKKGKNIYKLIEKGHKIYLEKS